MTPSSPDDEDTIVTRNSLAPEVSLHHLVRRGNESDLTAVANALAAAVHDDPVVRWIVPDDARRSNELAGLLRVFAARCQPHGENCVNETATGAALWLPPYASFTPAEDARYETAIMAAAGPDIERLGMFAEAMEAAHPAEPHHYLRLIGVAPAQQGIGVGAALLREVLDVADAAREPAYLEATTTRSRALYERHGFEVTRELRCADCPPVWAMWRDPA